MLYNLRNPKMGTSNLSNHIYLYIYLRPSQAIGANK